MRGMFPILQRAGRLLTSRTAVWCFFGVTLIIGLIIAKDYGISWDEKAMYVLGEDAYNYVLGKGAYPTHFGIRFHGAWFEIFQYAVQELFQLRFARDIFMLRHALNYLSFWIGLLCMYGIAIRTFKSRTWALVAVLMLFLSPRQFGHAFFNGRDIPAMSFFILKMFTLLIFLQKPTIKNAVLHGVASGLVIAIRVGLLFLPFYTLLFFGLKVVEDAVNEGQVHWKRYLPVLGIYAMTFVASTIFFWPLLWENPLRYGLDALGNMLWAQQPPGGFYLGETVGSLPWHWIPVHIVSKTPFLYVMLFGVAVVMLFRSIIRHPLSLLSDYRDALLFFLWFIIPILTVFFLKAALFDEWRHIYFIYPAMLLLAVSGLRGLFDGTRNMSEPYRRMFSGGLIAACSVSMVWTTLWIVRNHPLQYVYFSLPSSWVEGKFELDYWGVSFREGFEWILEQDDSDPISVSVTSAPGWENLNILTQEQRRRLLVRRQFDTKYILDNYRWNQYKHNLPSENKIHSITVSGMDVLGIYRNPNWDKEADRAQPRMNDYDVQLRFNETDKELWQKK